MERDQVLVPIVKLAREAGCSELQVLGVQATVELEEQAFWLLEQLVMVSSWQALDLSLFLKNWCHRLK